MTQYSFLNWRKICKAATYNFGSLHINFVELESPILHVKFQDNRTSGSGKEDV